MAYDSEAFTQRVKRVQWALSRTLSRKVTYKEAKEHVLSGKPEPVVPDELLGDSVPSSAGRVYRSPPPREPDVDEYGAFKGLLMPDSLFKK